MQNTMKYLVMTGSLLLALALGAGGAGTLQAEDGGGQAPQEKERERLLTSLSLGFVSGMGSNNLDPDLSSRYLDDLNSSPDNVSSFMAFVFPEITYNLTDEGKGPKLRFDTKAPTTRAGNFSFNLGLIYPTGVLGNVEVMAFYNPFQEVWRNPYYLDGPRKGPDITKYGMKVGASDVGNLPLSVDIIYQAEDVDKDEIGTLMPDLARDGSIYTVNVHYSVLRTRSYDIRPGIVVNRGDMDGESSSFVSVRAALGGRYTMGRLTWLPSISYERAEFDKTDPVFGVTRHTDIYRARLMANFIAPFGFRNWAVLGMIGYFQGDSNIEFYDTEGLGGGLFISYNF